MAAEQADDVGGMPPGIALALSGRLAAGWPAVLFLAAFLAAVFVLRVFVGRAMHRLCRAAPRCVKGDREFVVPPGTMVETMY